MTPCDMTVDNVNVNDRPHVNVKSMSSQCQVNVSQSVSHQSPVVVMSAMYIMLIKMWLYHYDNYQ